MTHQKIQELLAAYADGGLEGRQEEEVAAHVAACAACAAEVAAVRAVLSDVRRAPTAAEDETFFRDFARDVRVAYDRAESTGFWAWLQKHTVLAGACAVAAAALALLLVRPRTPEPQAAAPKPVPYVIVDQEDLSPEELGRVMAALDEPETDDDNDDEASLALIVSPELAVENLDDAAVQRVAAEL